MDRFDTFCSYCLKVRAPLRQVTIGHSTSWLCERCHERQEQRYRDMVPDEATFDQWVDWAGLRR